MQLLRTGRPCGPGLPQQFERFGVSERAQFGAVGLDGRGDAAAFDRMVVVGHVSPRQVRRAAMMSNTAQSS